MFQDENQNIFKARGMSVRWWTLRPQVVESGLGRLSRPGLTVVTHQQPILEGSIKHFFKITDSLQKSLSALQLIISNV